MFHRLLVFLFASFIQVVAPYKIHLANNSVLFGLKHNRCMIDNCVHAEKTGLEEFAQACFKMNMGKHVLTLQSLSW